MELETKENFDTNALVTAAQAVEPLIEGLAYKIMVLAARIEELGNQVHDMCHEFDRINVFAELVPCTQHYQDEPMGPVSD